MWLHEPEKSGIDVPPGTAGLGVAPLAGAAAGTADCPIAAVAVIVATATEKSKSSRCTFMLPCLHSHTIADRCAAH